MRDAWNREFYDSIRDIIYHPVVQQMKNFEQHCDTDCYEHCLAVAFYNFYICKKLNLDARSAARGGMLHDLFLYDWRGHAKRTGDHFHAMTHPRAAYNMAKQYFDLNPVEKEVILKHMWPVTVIPPRHWETYIICFTDKYCGSMEIARYYSRNSRARFIWRMLERAMHRMMKEFPQLPQVIQEFDSEENATRARSFVQLRTRRPAGWGRSLGRARASGRVRR